MDKNLLIIGAVWPEPNSSAAGSRMLQLIQLFKELHFTVHFCSAAEKNEYSASLDGLVKTETKIRLNTTDISELLSTLNPVAVLYDRFYIEEQYSWRVDAFNPEIIHILDTEDLHFLRKERESNYKSKSVSSHNKVKLRELGSIYRSDISIMISSFEIDLLTDLKVPHEQLIDIPFLYPELKEISTDEVSREHFCFIGNFLHEPNWQAVKILRQEIWPLIRSELPQAELHIYGAYGAQRVLDLHNEKEKFFIKGRAESVEDVFTTYRVNLAWLPFGAGLKGKVVEAMRCGLPTVTNKIATEGISHYSSELVQEDYEGFVKTCIMLYTNQKHWQEMSKNVIRTFKSDFSYETSSKNILNLLSKKLDDYKKVRARNTVGAILKSDLNNRNKYFALYLEEKNKNSI